MKKLYRTREGKSLCGVCSGLAEYLNVDVTVIRMLTVLASLCSGIGIVAYIAAVFIIPQEPEVI